MTDPWLVFNSSFPPVWIVVAATALALVFMWFEWKKDSRFKLLRVFAQIVVIVAVALILLRPSVRKEFDSNHTILLTRNFDRKIVDSLIAKHPGAKLKRTSEADNYRAAQTSAIVDAVSGITYVVGDGLTPAELDEIPDRTFTYIPSETQTGIVSITSEQPRVNQITKIYVQVNDDKAKRILIKGPGKTEDSVLVNQDQTVSTLQIRPKQAGQFLYSILTKDQNGAVIDQEPLALDVLPEQKIRLLILQEYPTAEVRYLKNFLADRGHAITLRYQLSRNVYRHEFANSEQKKINRLDTETLSNFDLVVIDSDVLRKIPSGERKQVETSLRQGLGLLVLFNESPQQTKSTDGIPGVAFAVTKSDTAYVPIISGTTTMVRTLGASAQSNEAVVPLLKTAEKKILTGYRYQGLGKSGFNLTTETYRFLIEGNENVYAAIWSPLLSAIARKKQERFALRIMTQQPIYPNEPISVEILSASGKPSLIADSTRVPLTEDVLIDDRWLGKTWFNEPGWNKLMIPEDSASVNLYIYPNGDLNVARINNQKKLNSFRQTTVENESTQITTGYEPISPIWFFVIFLIAAGFLWLSPKL
jgi:hypothetical protein